MDTIYMSKLMAGSFGEFRKWIYWAFAVFYTLMMLGVSVTSHYYLFFVGSYLIFIFTHLALNLFHIGLREEPTRFQSGEDKYKNSVQSIGVMWTIGLITTVFMFFVTPLLADIDPTIIYSQLSAVNTISVALLSTFPILVLHGVFLYVTYKVDRKITGFLTVTTMMSFIPIIYGVVLYSTDLVVNTDETVFIAISIVSAIVSVILFVFLTKTTKNLIVSDWNAEHSTQPPSAEVY